MSTQITTGVKLFYYVYEEFKKTRTFVSKKDFIHTIKEKLKSAHLEQLKKWRKGDEEIDLIFHEKTFQGYYKDFNIGKFQKVEHEEKKYGELLAVYAGFENLKTLKDDSSPISATDIQKTLDIIKMTAPVVQRETEESATLKFSEHFVTRKEIEALEFEEDGIEIYCVSHSLFWASCYLPEKIKGDLKLKNRYRYILTEEEGASFQGIIEALFDSKPYLKDHIEIRKLYSSPSVKQIKIGSVVFPISNDIVIYKKDGNYLRTIVGVNQLSSKVLPTHMVNVSEGRGRQLLHWFDETWKKLDSTSAIIDEVKKIG